MDPCFPENKNRLIGCALVIEALLVQDIYFLCFACHAHSDNSGTQLGRNQSPGHEWKQWLAQFRAQARAPYLKGKLYVGVRFCHLYLFRRLIALSHAIRSAKSKPVLSTMMQDLICQTAKSYLQRHMIQDGAKDEDMSDGLLAK